MGPNADCRYHRLSKVHAIGREIEPEVFKNKGLLSLASPIGALLEVTSYGNAQEGFKFMTALPIGLSLSVSYASLRTD